VAGALHHGPAWRAFAAHEEGDARESDLLMAFCATPLIG
jgi:hypothetical protein